MDVKAVLEIAISRASSAAARLGSVDPQRIWRSLEQSPWLYLPAPRPLLIRHGEVLCSAGSSLFGLGEPMILN